MIESDAILERKMKKKAKKEKKKAKKQKKELKKLKKKAKYAGVEGEVKHSNFIVKFICLVI